MNINQLSTALVKKAMKAGEVPQAIIDEWLNRHRRKFSPKPEGYATPDGIAASVMLQVINPDKSYLSSTHLGLLCARYCVNELNQVATYPWYFLDENLALDMALIDPPSQIPSDIILPPQALLVLPENSLKTKTGSLAYIAYSLIKSGQTCSITYYGNQGKPIIQELPAMDFDQLLWFGVEFGGMQFGGKTGLMPEEGCYQIVRETFEGSKSGDSQIEKEESDRVVAVLLNSLIYAQVNEPSKLKPISLGYGKNLNNTQPPKTRPQSPIFIGEGYESLISNNHGGKHASPKTHWRRGHWRRSPIGEGRNARAWRLIKPTLVNLPPTSEKQ